MPENIVHTIEGVALGYLLAGSLVFFLVSSLGVIEAAALTRAARGKPVTGPLMAIAIAISILMWPKMLNRLLRCPWIGEALVILCIGTFALSAAIDRILENISLARNLWGRP